MAWVVTRVVFTDTLVGSQSTQMPPSLPVGSTWVEAVRPRVLKNIPIELRPTLVSKGATTSGLLRRNKSQKLRLNFLFPAPQQFQIRMLKQSIKRLLSKGKWIGLPSSLWILLVHWIRVHVGF